MNLSVRLFTVRGIPVRVHASFLLILVWAAYVGLSDRGTNSALGSIAFTVVFTAALFICVVLHELGHSVVAQQFGVKVHDITLWPIGGVARLSAMPRRPSTEFAITAAGPVVNLILALIFLVATVAVMGPSRVLMMVETGRGWARLLDSQTAPALFALLTIQNLLLAVFNLVPAFPLDGGRLLRSFLAVMMPYRTATRAASFVGQGLAVVFVGLALIPPFNFFLVLVGAFVFIGAWQERSQVMMQERLTACSVRDAMQPLGRRLLPEERVADIARQIVALPQSAYPVLDEATGCFAGLITREALLYSAKRAGATGTVGEFMARNVPQVPPDMSLDEAQARFGPQGSAFVVERNYTVGVVCRADIARLDAALEVLAR
jgi:Zn-dependent protease/predicted transcriptional regulator